jgi:putative ABC transport system permease protein
MLDVLRFGLKSVTRRPLLAAAIVLPLAIATALSTALFSIADGLFYRPLPLKNAESTVVVAAPLSGARRTRLDAIVRDYGFSGRFRGALRESPLLATTIAFSPLNTAITLETGLKISIVDVRLFDYFGMSPALGRLFTAEDQAAADIARTASGILPAIVSDAYWRRELGANPEVIGQQITVAGQQVSIVGVMRPGVKFPARTDVWMPMNAAALNMHPAFVRLSPGATIEQLRVAFPLYNFTPLRASMRPAGAATVAFIFGAALALLLLAWVQVGGLMLATASDRLREIAVRVSLGARQGGIVAQFAAESFWLVAAALALSLLLTPALTHLLIGLLPDSLTSAQYLQPDGRAHVFAGVVSSLGFLLLTLTPLTLTRRVAPLLLMKGRAAESASPSRVRQGIQVVQLACTALLLYVAALAAFSYLNVLRHDYGFDAENVLFIEPPRIRAGVRNTDINTDKIRIATIAERIRRLPEVRFATPVMESPLKGMFRERRWDVIEVDRRPIDPVPTRLFTAGRDVVEALGATLVAGTSFDGPEYIGRKDVVLINETLAHQISAIATAVGRRIRTEHIDATVVGVLKDLVDSAPEIQAAPLLIQPSDGRGGVAHQLLVRTSVPATALIPTLRKIVEEDFGPMRSTQIRLLADDVEQTVLPWRGRAAVLTLVAALGLPLAVTGIASGLFFLVRTRTRELGVRLALGATPEQAREFVLAYARRIVALGAGLGILAGMLAGRAMSGQLFGVGAVSPVTTFVVAAIAVGLAWLAAYLPARRASRIDPATALRAE